MPVLCKFKILDLQNKLTNWGDFLYADTNAEMLKITLISIEWVWSKLGIVFKVMRL